MKAISIAQPWAWAIFYAGKNVENRKWSCAHRGLLAIHASKTWDAKGALWMKNMGIECPDVNSPIVYRGAFLGVVRLVDISCDAHSIWAIPSQFHWHFESPQLLFPPVEGRGRLGLFDVPDDELIPF